MTFVGILQALGSFGGGLAGRFGLFVAAGLVLLVPALVLGFGCHLLRRARDRAAGSGGVVWRRGAYHAPNHTWLAPRGRGELVVGLDDLARRLLPSVTAVDLPRTGRDVHRGDPVAIVRAGGRTVPVGAPVDGRIVRVNARVRRDPGVVWREPYGAGWLFSVAPADGAYLKFPQDGEAEGWLRAEWARLARVLEDELGLAAADGGALLVPAPAALGDDRWRRVLRTFLFPR
jgi:glycine cleavage system H protein